MTGGELIKTIIENSESWNKRTKFSQEKYLRKKMQKYAVTFEVKKPTALEICEAYTQNQPNRILGLRSDTLGLMMQMANINAESRVLLIDKTRGLMAGALIEKGVKEILYVELGGGNQ
jgi:tRNA (adenine58-N1)-methyltransferase non-catalytic subunit